MEIKTINSNIAKLAKAERVTKEVLATLSRDILTYVYVDGTEDISPVNRLLQVLTPMNKRTAVLFFKNFLAWRFDEESMTFTKKKKKQFDDKNLAVGLFLDNADNNIWTWATENVELKAKPVDWNAKLTRDMTKALEAGLTFNDIVNILNTVVNEEGEQQEAA